MWKKLPGVHELSTVAIGCSDPAAAQAKLTEYVNASIFGSAVASGIQACLGNWQEAERLGRQSGDVLGGRQGIQHFAIIVHLLETVVARRYWCDHCMSR